MLYINICTIMFCLDIYLRSTENRKLIFAAVLHFRRYYTFNDIFYHTFLTYIFVFDSISIFCSHIDEK